MLRVYTMRIAAWFWTSKFVMLTVCTVSSAAWFWTKELVVLTEFAQCILLHDSEPKNLLCWEFTQCVLLHDSEPENSFCWQSLHRVYCSMALTQGTATKQTTPIPQSTPSSTQLICRWVAFRHSPMNECVVICEANEIFHTRICNFTAQGLGGKKHTFSYTHIVRSAVSQAHKHTHTHMPNTHTCVQTDTH